MNEATREHWLSGKSGKLHVVEWPARSHENHTPHLLLLHGSMGNVLMWESIAPVLAARHRVFALDLRGHGQSDWAVPPRYRLRDYAEDVHAVLTALELRDVVLIGHSLGSLVTMTVALDGPAAPRGAALIDIEATPPPHQAQHLNAAGDRPPRAFASKQEGIAALQRRYAMVPPDQAARIAQAGLRQRLDGGWEEATDRESLRGFEQAQLHDRLGGLAIPTLVIRGADSTVMRHDVAVEMAARLPSGRLVEIAGAGHQLLLEQPASVANALTTWLFESFNQGRSHLS